MADLQNDLVQDVSRSAFRDEGVTKGWMPDGGDALRELKEVPLSE
jgi:hypothetical protein